MTFRGLEKDFFDELNKDNSHLHFILEFEQKHRKSFMVEIRNNFLDLYFLGHAIEVRKRKNKFLLIASNKFNPKENLDNSRRSIVKTYGPNKWFIDFEDIESYSCYEAIISEAMAQIVRHRKGDITEGVSEVNHFIDNRSIRKNGILVIDRQVVYPGSKKNRMDLLGLRRIDNGKYTFSVIELKNKNNKDIENVFMQVKNYIDVVYDNYEHFRSTYEKVIKQKVKLRMLKKLTCEIAAKNEIEKKQIEGVVILDNYNIRSDLREKTRGLLGRAIVDWGKIKDNYSIGLFLKTNVLDNTFFYDYEKANGLLEKLKKINLSGNKFRSASPY